MFLCGPTVFVCLCFFLLARWYSLLLLLFVFVVLLSLLSPGENLPRRSPRRPSSAAFQRSNSFYGASSSARPLTRTRSFTAGGSHKSPGKVPFDLGGEQASEDDQPSLHFSPNIKKRFALHSLLTSVCSSDKKKKISQAGTPPRQATTTAVRSSPRLLKRRSFSCIGFSTSVPLETGRSPGKTHTAAEAQHSDGAAVAASNAPLPSKTRLFSPARRSPRLNSSSGKQKKISQAGTPPRKATTTAVRSSPRLLKRRSFSCIGFSTSVPLEADRSPGKTHTAAETQHSDDAAVAASDSPLPSKTRLFSPARRSPRLKQKRLSGGTKVVENEACDATNHAIADTNSTEEIVGNVEEHLQPFLEDNLLRARGCKSDPVLRTEINTSLTSSRLSCSPNQEKGPELNRTPAKGPSVGEGEMVADNSLGSTQKCPRLETPCPVGTSPDRTDQSRSQGDGCVVLLNPVSKKILLSKRKQARYSPCAGESVQDTLREKGVGSEESPRNSRVQVWGVRGGAEAVSGGKASLDQMVCSTENHVRDPPTPIKSPPTSRERLSGGKGGLSVVLADLLKSPEVSAGGKSPLMSRSCSSRVSPAKSTQLAPRERPATPNNASKRSKRRATTSPVEAERLSPLNQILKQRKRKRADFGKAGKDDLMDESPLPELKIVLQSPARKKHGTEKRNKHNVSRTSSDESDWLCEIEKEQNESASLPAADELCFSSRVTRRTTPPNKRLRIDKSKVFGISRGKTKRLPLTSTLSNCDPAFDDDFLRFSPVRGRLKGKQRLPKTPISAGSLKFLQESPILCNESVESKSSLPLQGIEESGDSPLDGQHMELRERQSRKS